MMNSLNINKSAGPLLRRIAGWLPGLFIVLCLSQGALAQEMTFNAKVSRNPVPAGERFTVTITLSNARAKISPPDMGGLQIIFGPSQSESTTIYNGKYSSSFQVSYVVLAEREGKYTIGKAKAYTDKGVLETDPITVVVEKSQYGSNGGGQPGGASAAAPSPSNQKGDIILSVIPSKSKAVIGEPIQVTYYLYSRFPRLELGKYDFPAISGFWCEDLKQQSTTWENNLATINGARYQVAVLKKQVIYPQKSGKFQVKPFELECIVNRSFFSVGQKVKVGSNSPTIEVSPYPANKPLDFQEFSGNYKLESSISSRDVKANEPITIKLKISGDGNLKTITSPKLNFPSDFEVYDPKVNDRIRLTGSGLTGSREFEYLIIPRFAGEYTVPAFQMSYFDLGSRSYKTLSSQEFKIKVAKGSGQAAGAYTPSNQQQVQTLNKDIRYIITGPLVIDTMPPLTPDRPLFWILLGGLPLAVLITGFRRSKAKQLRKDQVKLKATKANKVANRHLATAKKALETKNTNLFYEATFKALYGYLSDRLSIPVGDLSRRVIELKLHGLQVDNVLVSDLLNTLDTCEMARFAPMSERSPEEIYQKSFDIINKLEKALK